MIPNTNSLRACSIEVIVLLFVGLTAAQNEGDVRLVNGTGPGRGNVEFYHQDRWRSVCADHWDLNPATVACRQLGFYSALAAPRQTFSGKRSGGSLQVHPYRVRCSGFEARLADCPGNALKKNNCSSSGYAGVACSKLNLDEDLDFRLVGNYRGRGRLEIFHKNRWGTLCARNWKTNIATIICGELGYLTGTLTRRTGSFGYSRSGQPFFHADLVCSGQETRFANCLRRSELTKSADCSGLQGADIICSREATEGSVRLAAGSSRNAGRVEMMVQDEWSAICGKSWKISQAIVVCRELGLGPALVARHDGARFGNVDHDQLLMIQEKFICKGNESALRNCPLKRSGQRTCDHGGYASVECIE